MLVVGLATNISWKHYGDHKPPWGHSPEVLVVLGVGSRSCDKSPMRVGGRKVTTSQVLVVLGVSRLASCLTMPGTAYLSREWFVCEGLQCVCGALKTRFPTWCVGCQREVCLYSLYLPRWGRWKSGQWNGSHGKAGNLQVRNSYYSNCCLSMSCRDVKWARDCQRRIRMKSHPVGHASHTFRWQSRSKVVCFTRGPRPL